MALDPRSGRRLAFWYAAVWLVALLALGFFWARGDLKGAVKSVPVAVLASGWAGALGGVAISLKGVYDHWVDARDHPQGKTGWNNELLLWHLGRPVSGAVVGVAVFLVFKAAYPSGSPSPAALAAASFVLGLQEKRFFAWIKEIGGAILSVPGKQPSPGDGAGPSVEGEGSG